MKPSSMKHRLAAYEAKIQALLDEELDGLITEVELFEAIREEIHPLVGKRFQDCTAEEAALFLSWHSQKAAEQVARTEALIGRSARPAMAQPTKLQ